MIGAVLVGGFVGLTALRDAEARLPVLHGAPIALAGRPAGLQTRAAGRAEEYVVARALNDQAGGPIATHDSSPAVFIDEAIRDWRPANKREVVGQVQLLLNRTGCTLSAPAEGARLVNLMVEHSDTLVGLYSFTDQEVQQAVDDWFRDIKYGNRAPGDALPMRYSHEFHLHDIAVTDTRTPLHMVLQNPGPGNYVYNFHLAPGVEIAGVSMLGGDANAVANLPETVPVEVMDRATLEACGTGVTDPGRVEIQLTHRRNNGHLSEEDEQAIRDEWRLKVQTFEDWFVRQFGVGSDTTRIGLSYAEVSLIGPVWREGELTGVPYRPFAGAHLVAQTEAHFAVTGLHDWPAAFNDEVRRLGARMAGGNPADVLLPRYFAREF
ncbi:hypothetical protein STA1M1_29430 [Sinisalibacter aestuarii]|uniref:Uncharacterized protein n=2 Tax=Sinisalibacter aestuarii TaxID=2949426 RepID=A0ABQ5LVQ2_9RHOB|nr:hypothetical protein STA1M1_29430 [Sinisalibacter aestuarii]